MRGKLRVYCVCSTYTYVVSKISAPYTHLSKLEIDERPTASTDLRIPDQHKLRVWASRGKGAHLANYSSRAFFDRFRIGWIASRRRVVDGLSCRSWVSVQDFVDDRTS